MSSEAFEKSVTLSTRHLLSVADLSVDDITLILDSAERFHQILDQPVRKLDLLKGFSLINVFFEPSTRTRTSFELAGKRLGADTVNFSASASSLFKGECLIDTFLTLEAMRPDVLVIRHKTAGVPDLVARVCSGPVIINAGDGMHEHPTQALLDAFTVRRRKGKLEGLKVSIIGDIAHSRVARSNALLFEKFDTEVVFCGPPTLIPPGCEGLGARAETRLEAALEGADVVMALRSQRERQKEAFVPSAGEYSSLYGLSPAAMALAKEDAIVLHPGPINRGMEMDSDVADHSLILEQVTNGTAVRMAILALLLGSNEKGRMTP